VVYPILFILLPFSAEIWRVWEDIDDSLYMYIYTNIAKIARIVTPPEKRNNFSDFSQFSGLIGGFSQQPGILATLFLSPNFDHPPVHDAS